MIIPRRTKWHCYQAFKLRISWKEFIIIMEKVLHAIFIIKKMHSRTKKLRRNYIVVSEHANL